MKMSDVMPVLSHSACPGCERRTPRVSSRRAQELLGVRPGQQWVVPRTWGVCMAAEGFHVPRAELQRLRDGRSR